MLLRQSDSVHSLAPRRNIIILITFGCKWARKSPTATQGGIIIKRAFSISPKRFLLYIILFLKPHTRKKAQIGTVEVLGTTWTTTRSTEGIVGTLQIRVCCVYLISNDWHHKNHYSICHKLGTVHHPLVAGRSHPYPCRSHGTYYSYLHGLYCFPETNWVEGY